MAGCEDTTAAVTDTDEIRSALLRVIDLVNNSVNSQPTSRPIGSTSIVDNDDKIPPLLPIIIPLNQPSIYSGRSRSMITMGPGGSSSSSIDIPFSSQRIGEKSLYFGLAAL